MKKQVIELSEREMCFKYTLWCVHICSSVIGQQLEFKGFTICISYTALKGGGSLEWYPGINYYEANPESEGNAVKLQNILPQDVVKVTNSDGPETGLQKPVGEHFGSSTSSTQPAADLMVAVFQKGNLKGRLPARGKTGFGISCVYFVFN